MTERKEWAAIVTTSMANYEKFHDDGSETGGGKGRRGSWEGGMWEGWQEMRGRGRVKLVINFRIDQRCLKLMFQSFQNLDPPLN